MGISGCGGLIREVRLYILKGGWFNGGGYKGEA